MGKVFLGVLGVAINAVLLPFGQYLWKLSLSEGYSMRVFASKHFILGACCYAVGTVFWLFALSIFPLSKIYPFISLSYIFGAFLGYALLKETVNWVNVLGYILLLISLLLIAYRNH